MRIDTALLFDLSLNKVKIFEKEAEDYRDKELKIKKKLFGRKLTIKFDLCMAKYDRSRQRGAEFSSFLVQFNYI